MARNCTIVLLRRPAAWPGPGSLEADATFAAEFPAFDGHFPGHPILPGFAHIQLAVDVLQQAFPAVGALREIRAAKFVRPIRPGELVRIRLCAGADGAVHGSLHFGEELASSLEFVLEATADCTDQKS